MMWNLPTQATVSAVTTTTTINSRNNANTNNRIVNDTNSILIQSNTATTGTNNRTDNKNTNNNAVNDSKKLLTRTSASTTTPNNNTNSVNANNLEKNTSNKLIPSNIDEEKNESEKCGNAVKQGAKEKILVLNSEQQKKGRTLIIGDSMLAGLREAKVSRSKRIKVRYFSGGKTEDLQYHLILYLKKEPDNIIIHIGINDSPYKTEDFIYKELVNVKETIIKFHPNCKNFVKEANNILKKYNNISKQEERNVIFHNNISASHLHGDGLHLNLNGTIILAGNLLSRVRMF